MISDEKSLAKKEYKRYVDAAIGDEQEDPLKSVYGGIILGGTRFIKETLRRIKEDLLQMEDISHTKVLRTEHGVEEILDFVSDFYNIRKEEIIKKKDIKLRKLAIYLVKTNTGATNKEIGKVFGCIHPTTVSKIYERFSMELENNRKLKKEIIKVDRELSHVEN
jgi:chromosomal replication initiation ATPase DnaA